LRFYTDSGLQPARVVGGPNNDTYSRDLAPGETAVFRLDDTGPLSQGWVAVDLKGKVNGQCIFYWTLPNPGSSQLATHPAAVPLLEHGAQSSITLGGGIPINPVPVPRKLKVPFHNTNEKLSGLALANVSDRAQTLGLEYRTYDGQLLGTEQKELPGLGHIAFNTRHPATAGREGNIHIIGDATYISSMPLVFMNFPVGPFGTELSNYYTAKDRSFHPSSRRA
jgi:hypothetical protein